MFEEGQIIYFDPFYFKNGNTAKPKYFVILKKYDGISLVASLPTRKDARPNDYSNDFGCIEIPEINFNCFAISKEIEITICGKKFDFNTFLFAHQIDDYSVNLLSEIYQNEGTDFVIWGEMKPEIFKNLILCFKNSRSIKRKFKQIL